MGFWDFFIWFSGIILSGGFLIHFIWTKNDEIISTRIGLLIAAIACLIPFINIGVGIGFAYMKFEDWLTDSPFRGRT